MRLDAGQENCRRPSIRHWRWQRITPTSFYVALIVICAAHDHLCFFAGAGEWRLSARISGDRSVNCGMDQRAIEVERPRA
jgi:hypothetical protein